MNESSKWYAELIKPFWAPPQWVFGTVWSLLYPIIIAVNVYIVVLLVQGKISWLIALPFWLNIFANLIFTPIQFGLRNNWLASLDIIFIFATTIWAIIAIYNYNKWLSLAFVPYAIWVLIATILQIYIAIKN